MAGSLPNFHKMDPRSACIQDVLKVKFKVKGHVIGALLCWRENLFFSQANGPIATKLAHDVHQVNLHPGCVQGEGQGQRSRDTRTFVDSCNELLRHWRSGYSIYDIWEVKLKVQGQKSVILKVFQLSQLYHDVMYTKCVHSTDIEVILSWNVAFQQNFW